MEERLSIRAAAARYHVSARTLRFYEDIGILTSLRREGSGYREYNSDQLQRLELILLLRRLSFSVKEIAGLLRGEAVFIEALKKHVRESDTRLLEQSELNRLLHKLESELAEKDMGDISAADILRELVFLTTKIERMFYMTPQDNDKYMVLLGWDIAGPVTQNGEGGLVNKILALRESVPDLPIIRLRDDSKLGLTEILIIWNGREVWRGDIGSDAVKCADFIIEKLKELMETR